ncbi:glycosyltransferase involved in cell wall biosynthesis [Hasllibacter halocynthiae]|uniref:Glycosyltransferase involved in cell wall biosynthesis n=1 Tax=Hasllibacter halocynthiae TaxID=595589 RepID=A0A2T0X2R4_9RHOB|nr:glycosyltransferase family 4 protein [Hasllibacter halocynthiae]PRY93144.1 glycosyltransferase involved in cell wall biosynthesis [Hasllibacter halocynthiae]
MKVLYLHQYFATPRMAGGTRSYEMARRMVAAGHEVHVVTSWREGTDRRGWWQEEVDGIQVHWLPVPYRNAMGPLARLRAFARFARLARARATGIGGDVVLSTSTPLTIAVPGVRAARRLGVPHVLEVRDLWPALPVAMGILRDPVSIHLARRLERYAYRNSARVLALSPGMARGVVAAGYPEGRVTVAPNSCDTDLFAPDPAGAARFRAARPELGEGPIVLYAGTFGRINGVEYLARLAAAMAGIRPDVRFVAIGGGARADAVRAEAGRLGVLGRNYFQYPAMPKTALVDAFRAARVSTSLFVDLPEMRHNSANKFFDALASGTPVAINYGGWQADLVAEHGLGLALAPGDPDAAARALAGLLADEGRLAAASRAAEALAQGEFGRDAVARRVIGTLERAVEEAS